MISSAERFSQGQETFAHALSALLRRNDLTHQEFRELTQWASEGNPVSMAQISYLKSGKLLLGMACCDSIGQANLGLAWLAGDTSQDAQAMSELGLPSGTLQQRLAHPWYLRHPETGLPMHTGDLAMVWVGRLLPLEIGKAAFLPSETAALSRSIAARIEGWMTLEGISLSQAWPRIANTYPNHDIKALERLRRVLGMGEAWTPPELHDELPNLAHLVGELTDGDPMSTAELLEEVYRR